MFNYNFFNMTMQRFARVVPPSNCFLQNGVIGRSCTVLLQVFACFVVKIK